MSRATHRPGPLRVLAAFCRRPVLRLIGAVAIVALVGSGSMFFTPAAGAAQPSVARDDAYFVALGSTLDVAAPGVLKNDTTDPNTTYTLVLTDATGLPGSSWVGLHDDGSFHFDSADAPAGAVSFDYCLTPAGALQCESTATVTLYVGTVLRDPSPVATQEDQPTTGNVLTSQSNPEGFGAALVTAPVNGTVVLNSDGSFTYTPNADFHGADSFVFCMTSGIGCLTDQVATQPITVQASSTPTTTTLTGPSTVYYGQPASLDATVSPAVDGGTIAFADGATSVAGCAAVPVSGSAASCTVAELDVGTHSLTAGYSGSADFDPSTSAVHPVTVLAAPTTLEYTGSGSGTVGVPMQASARLTSTATGSAVPVPGQSVSFTMANQVSCTAITDAQGVATCTLTPNRAGALDLTVILGGTAQYQEAQIDPAVTVAGKASTTILTGPGTVYYGQPIPLHATVSPAVDGGTIAFSNGTTVVPGCAAVVVVDSAADCTVNGPLDVGQYSFSASFSGTADAEPSTSSPLTVDVPKVATALRYTGPTAGTVGEPLQVAATLTAAESGVPGVTGPQQPANRLRGERSPALVVAAAPTANAIAAQTIDFRIGSASCSAVTDSSGVARCSLTPTSAGPSATLMVTFAGTDHLAAARVNVDTAIAAASTTPQTSSTSTGPASTDVPPPSTGGKLPDTGAVSIWWVVAALGLVLTGATLMTASRFTRHDRRSRSPHPLR